MVPDEITHMWALVKKALADYGNPSPINIDRLAVGIGETLPASTVEGWFKTWSVVPPCEKFMILIKALGAERDQDWRTVHDAAQTADRQRKKNNRQRRQASSAATTPPTVADPVEQSAGEQNAFEVPPPPSAPLSLGQMNSEEQRSAERSPIVAESQVEPPGRDDRADRPRRHGLRRLAIGIAAVIVLGLVAAWAFSSSPDSPKPGNCQQAWKYRVTSAGDLLSGDRIRIGGVVEGDIVTVRERNITVYQHRYLATVLRTGMEGYVDQAKLVFVECA